MKLYTTKEAAEFLNVAVSTIIRWDNEGRIRSQRTPGGHRRFTEEELLRVIGLSESQQALRVALYSRVSTQEQDSGLLDRQRDRLRQHAQTQGYEIVAELDETASGADESRPNLQHLLRMVREGKVDVVVVEHQDRLAHFGYRYLERYITDFGARIEVLEDRAASGSTHEELVQDFLDIVTDFSTRLYGVRGASIVRRVAEALEDEDEALGAVP